MKELIEFRKDFKPIREMKQALDYAYSYPRDKSQKDRIAAEGLRKLKAAIIQLADRYRKTV